MTHEGISLFNLICFTIWGEHLYRTVCIPISFRRPCSTTVHRSSHATPCSAALAPWYHTISWRDTAICVQDHIIKFLSLGKSSYPQRGASAVSFFKALKRISGSWHFLPCSTLALFSSPPALIVETQQESLLESCPQKSFPASTPGICSYEIVGSVSDSFNNNTIIYDGPGAHANHVVRIAPWAVRRQLQFFVHCLWTG